MPNSLFLQNPDTSYILWTLKLFLHQELFI